MIKGRVANVVVGLSSALSVVEHPIGKRIDRSGHEFGSRQERKTFFFVKGTESPGFCHNRGRANCN